MMVIAAQLCYNVAMKEILKDFIFHERNPVDAQHVALMELVKSVFLFRERTTAVMQWVLQEMDFGGWE